MHDEWQSGERHEPVPRGPWPNANQPAILAASPRSTAANRHRGSTSKPTTPRGTASSWLALCFNPASWTNFGSSSHQPWLEAVDDCSRARRNSASWSCSQHWRGHVEQRLASAIRKWPGMGCRGLVIASRARTCELTGRRQVGRPVSRICLSVSRFAATADLTREAASGATRRSGPVGWRFMVLVRAVPFPASSST